MFSWRPSVAHYSGCASFVRASGANPLSTGRARSNLEARKEKLSRRPHSPSQLLRELLRLPPLQPAKGGGGGQTRRRPPSRALLHAGGREGGGSRGPAAPARWPSKDPPGPMAGGATSPDWCRRSADHCGNPGGGELGRMRSPERGEPEG